MSTALAIAGVTAVLRDLLDSGFVDNDVSARTGQTVTVSVGPPDRVTVGVGAEATQLNLFMYRVTPNSGWRNELLPAADSAGRQRLSNSPLALDLHYLISAYGNSDFHAEILLGYAMQLLHDFPVITRKAIRRSLASKEGETWDLSATRHSLADTGLEDQAEQLRITPEYLSTEDLSKLWTATQSRLRPTAAYTVSVVLIEAAHATKPTLPVLTVGPLVKPDPLDRRTWYPRGVAVQSHLRPAGPMLDGVEPGGGQAVAQLDLPVVLRGSRLAGQDGTPRKVVLRHERFDIETELDAVVVGDDADAALSFTLPAGRADDLPAGLWSVSVRVTRAGDAAPRESNRLALTLAPQLVRAPHQVALSPEGKASLTVGALPALRPGQRVRLLVGDREFAGQAVETTSTTAVFDIDHVPAGEHLLRLRVDGIESPCVDRSVQPPEFTGPRLTVS